MKVLLVLADNLYLTPYIQTYLTILQDEKIDYEVVFWDKNNNETHKNPAFQQFNITGDSAIAKVFGYLKFKRKVSRIIQKDHISFIICLHPICNFLLFFILMRKFKHNYIFDVRDFSYEKHLVVRLMEQQLAKYSAINVISSEGYKAFLPNAKYSIAHNIPEIESKEQLSITSTTPIKVSYIGLIRFMEQNKKIINFFGNDNRFQLQFIGTNANKLREYCIKNKINNVTLIDTFSEEKTLYYFEQSSMILNLYGNHTPLLDYALSNKLYYAAILKKPILVCEDTYMERISHKYGFGFTLRMESKKELDELHHYYLHLDKTKLQVNCNQFMSVVFRQQKEYVDDVKTVLKSN
ncbi:capsular biosynthesis protein [Levilactobacillus brevis]|uniref:capsular biosynthesis protein n=1 Tax=Lactobacillaceae TaxID=33958 RepID=UPI00076CBE32|nr:MULTISPECIES: capsular biosynthesis protein [Lactobacillaceae]KWT43289.1 capsular biosynthesis protein [Lactiplantibacillus plantarum]RWZ42975.1 capsular biosynthesis protein [Levilactobacillus brevis]